MAKRSTEQEKARLEEQRRIRERAMKAVGTVRGGDPGRAEKAGSEVRSRLLRRYGRKV